MNVTYDWHDDFYERKVMPAINRMMGEDCRGFFTWLAENNPELYARIEAADKEICSLWNPEADRKSFQAACKVWYTLLMEAKAGFDAWKVKQKQEQELVGKQEVMGLR